MPEVPIKISLVYRNAFYKEDAIEVNAWDILMI